MSARHTVSVRFRDVQLCEVIQALVMRLSAPTNVEASMRQWRSQTSALVRCRRALADLRRRG